MDFVGELSKIHFVDDEADMEMLYEFIDRVEELPNKKDAVPAIFDFFEKNSNKELGSPSPLVHFLEDGDDYTDELKLSIDRKPTALTVWMVNRIINALSGIEYEFWLEKLRDVCCHPDADTSAKDSANEFIGYQCDNI